MDIEKERGCGDVYGGGGILCNGGQDAAGNRCPNIGKSFERHQARLVLNNDKMQGITMVNALGATKRSKLIDLRHQYLMQQIRQNNIENKHVPSKILPADMFTKGLERQRFEMIRRMIAVEEIPNL